MDVCLVNMPYAGLERPSIGLGILEAYLKKDHRSFRSIYANLLFAEHIGLDAYYFIELSSNEDLLGEWTFGGLAFPEFSPDWNKYFDLFRDMNEVLKSKIIAVRAKTDEFIASLSQQILSLNPRIVGCTSTFQQNCASLALLRKIKQMQPSVITMMGGANCEAQMGMAILKIAPWVDYIVSGEAEEIFSELLYRLLDDRLSPGTNKFPAGVLTQHQLIGESQGFAKKIAQVPRAVAVKMDNIPTPEYGSYFTALHMSGLRRFIRPGLLMETSRGCWWGAKHHCTFCGLNGEGMAFRSKSADRVVEEFNQLSIQYGIYDFEIVDNILDLQYLDSVMPRLARSQKKYKIFYETKSNLRRSQVEKLAKGGVTWIQPGIESLNDDFLKAIDKGVDAVQNVAMLKWCREFGIRVSWNVLFGAPGESDHWFQEMVGLFPLLFHLQPPQAITKIRFDRFSPYFNQQSRYNLDLVPSSAYSYVYPGEKDELKEIAYFFEDSSTASLKKPVGRDPLYTSTAQKKLQELINSWALHFWGMAGRPLLCAVIKHTTLTIIDTRPIAIKRKYCFTGISAKLYSFCYEPVSKSTLLNKVRIEMNDQSIAWEAFSDHIDEFIQNKLLILISGKYLALALEGSIPEVPMVSEFPGGYLDVPEFTWEYKPTVNFLGTLS